jgi:hypothetical protein
MTKNPDQPPLAGPDTQSAPRAKGGGTYGQQDFSVSAQRSRLETDQLGDRPISVDQAEVYDAADSTAPKAVP